MPARSGHTLATSQLNLPPAPTDRGPTGVE
jgi:hypothetical protein